MMGFFEKLKRFSAGCVIYRYKAFKSMERTMLTMFLWLVAIMASAQVKVLEHIYSLPDTTAETVFEYAKNHNVEDINGKTVILWHPYAEIGVSIGDKYLGIIPVTFLSQQQDFTLKNGEPYDNGKILLYVPIKPNLFELTAQKVDIIRAKLKAPFVLNDKNDNSWIKDKFKISAKEEWVLGERNIYVTFHCLSYPKQYRYGFLK